MDPEIYEWVVYLAAQSISGFSLLNSIIVGIYTYGFLTMHKHKKQREMILLQGHWLKMLKDGAAYVTALNYCTHAGPDWKQKFRYHMLFVL